MLEEGKNIVQDNHQDLLQNKGKYYAMWQHQNGNFPVED